MKNVSEWEIKMIIFFWGNESKLSGSTEIIALSC
jgi:hypothetical protein